MLEVEDLEIAYGPVRALRGVSFAVPKATITAVLGANGAGKTSLLRTLSVLVRARSGRIWLCGRDALRAPIEQIVRRGRLQLPQRRRVNDALSGEENSL